MVSVGKETNGELHVGNTTKRKRNIAGAASGMSNQNHMQQRIPKFTDGIKPTWEPRVPPGKIQQMYRDAARGLMDDGLIADVGTCLFLRCKSILVANEANVGRAACPRCETIIPHTRDKRQRIRCSKCGWQTLWVHYAQTFDGKGLLGGGSIPFVHGYVETYPLAQTPRERIILIERLIHAFHWEMHHQIGMSRPVACDLIAGRFEDVVTFLDTLAYGEHTTPEVQQEHAAWERKAARSGEWFRQALVASRAHRMGERSAE
jgi:ribosomal protein S27AE